MCGWIHHFKQHNRSGDSMANQRQRIAILTEAVNIMGEHVHMAKALQDNRIAIELVS
jgi:hypothetical protein